MDEVSRRSTNTFHCWVNCGRRFGSKARTLPVGVVPGTSSAKPVAIVPAAGRRVVDDVRLEEERRVHGQPQVGARALHVLGDAVAAADDPAVGRLPGEAEARLEPLVVGLVERAVLDAAVRREGLHAGPVAEGRRHVEVRLPVVLLDEGRRVGPAQAEVHGQVGPDLEVVLDEERDPVLEVRPRVVGVAAATALARHLVEEEVREGDAGEGAGVAERARARRCCRRSTGAGRSAGTGRRTSGRGGP